jgi:hypothetical protein
MIKNTSKLAGWAASSLALVATAFADVKVNEHFSVNGYAVGAVTTTDVDGAPSIDTYFENKGSPAVVNADAVKLGVLGSIEQLSAYGSILYLPGASNEAGLLDAYVTFDTGTGLKITGGKFLSYMGYEAFDPINMAQLTYGSTIYAIAGYHSGAKVDFSGNGFTIGGALVDSVFHGPNGFFEGDRDFDDDLGWEAYVSYTGVEKLTVFAGVSGENTEGAADDLFIFDLWASYAVTDKLTLAAEYDVQNDVMNGWLLFAGYSFTDKFSTIFRISGVDWEAGGNDTKYTVAPTYKINDNFSFRAEFSVGEGDSGDYNFLGGQVVFKF